MVDGATRVALLARAGDARARLEQALREAGAELVVVADPSDTDVSEVAAAAPQAILVALEPAIEDALEGYESLLADPAIAVIFDEAELAAQRAGWDAARWVRHLSAKLNRHDDVLPPGREHDPGDWQPSPGPLSQDGGEVSEHDLASIASEAMNVADQVPRDGGLDAGDTTGLSLEEIGSGPEHWAPEERTEVPAVEADPSEMHESRPALDFELEGDGAGASGGAEEDEDALPGLSAGLEAEELDAAELEAIALGGDTLQAVNLEGYDLEGFTLEDLSFASAEDDDPSADNGPRADGTRGVADSGDAAAAADASGEAQQPTEQVLEFEGFDFDLGEGEAASAAEPEPERSGPDLAALEQRIAGLSLAETDSYGHGPERGAVVIEGGLGGPDAVRQLLAAIPAGFPRPVLVRLRLDGGRYDRLVRQMERAAQLPVMLAEEGAAIEPAHVYFLPPDIGVGRERAQLRFVADKGAGATLPGSLPPDDSAVLFLSGSDPTLVDAAMSQAWGGALVAGQSPEGCYDGSASDIVIARGGRSGVPRQLAEELAERWPPPGQPSGAHLEEPIA